MHVLLWILSKNIWKKTKIKKHYAKYHADLYQFCEICNYKCSCKDIITHAKQCHNYHNTIKRLYLQINNNNEIIDKLKSKFNDPEYEEVYKFSYLIFVYNEVFPHSYFMPTNLLAKYLGYTLHKI